MPPLRIATRKSPLALWQAQHVAGLLRARVPGIEVALVELSTEGDRMLDSPLSRIGGKGLFVKEIEAALLDGRADLAVHSLKDVTSSFPPGLVLAAVPEREDPRDAWVSPGGVAFTAIPRGARVGTSSLRRACQLLALRPDVEVVSLRGNVGTRSGRPRSSGLAGSILALAGLRRLGLEARVTERLAPEVMLPAVGQGALALECAADGPHRSLVESLEHRPTRVPVDAERAFLEVLEGGCTVPLAAHAILEGEQLWVRALVGAPDGSEVVRAERRGPASRARALGAGAGRGAAPPWRPGPARRARRSRLRWLSRSPERLAGVRVLVPRPRERAEPLCFLLEDEGAEVLAFPLARARATVRPPAAAGRGGAAAPLRLGRLRQRAGGDRAGGGGAHRRDARRAPDAEARRGRAGDGGGAGRAWTRAHAGGDRVDRRGPGRGARSAGSRPATRCCLPVAEQGRPALEDGLTAAGATVERVAAYRSTPAGSAPEGWAEVVARPPRCVLFGSPRTVEAFLSLPGAEALARTVRAVAVGPTTAAALRSRGWEPAAVATAPTPPEWVEAAVRAIEG